MDEAISSFVKQACLASPGTSAGCKAEDETPFFGSGVPAGLDTAPPDAKARLVPEERLAVDGQIEALVGFAPANAAARFGAGAVVAAAAVEAASHLTGGNEVLAEEAKGVSDLGQEAHPCGMAAEGDAFGGESGADPGDVAVAADGKFQTVPGPGADADAAGGHAGGTGQIMIAVKLLQGERSEAKPAGCPKGDTIMGLNVEIGVEGVERCLGGTIESLAVGVIHGGGAAHHGGPDQCLLAGVKIETQAAEQARAASEAATSQVEEAQTAASEKIDAFRASYPASLRWPYRLEREAFTSPFLVEAMWTDGRFTYLRSHAQEAPALYELKDGKPSQVAYDLSGDGLYIARHVLGPGLLRIGEKQVRWRVVEEE